MTTTSDWRKMFTEIDGSIPSKTQEKYIIFITDLLAEEKEKLRKKIDSMDTKPCVCSKDGICEYNKGFQKALFFLKELIK